ncbi:MAG: chorismate synthase [Ruminococcaceae bacterium]|nr:chorismate synthase [Oscillospiraceae bacterium]
MSCNFGNKIKITIFGQSHSEAIGVIIDGLPAGFKIDTKKTAAFMARRAPGKNDLSTPRKEADEVKILSGVVDNITCGAPLCAVIENTNTRSGDYDKLRKLPRPSHSDFAAMMKHNGFNDIRGGGNFSGRLTAPLCFAGAVCMQMLEEKGIRIGAHISSIGKVDDKQFDPVNVSADDFDSLLVKAFPVINDKQGELMRKEIYDAKGSGDSVGGTIECAVIGMPVGIGDPIFDGIENRLAAAIFGIPAIKGIEFGSGFDGSRLTGSQNNDDFISENGKIKTATNNHGGILGGISSGMPIVFRCAVKPTPSIGMQQQSVNTETGEEESLVIGGRHDPCIVPRAVPCIEAAAAVVIADFLL